MIILKIYLYIFFILVIYPTFIKYKKNSLTNKLILITVKFLNNKKKIYIKESGINLNPPVSHLDLDTIN